MGLSTSNNFTNYSISCSQYYKMKKSCIDCDRYVTISFVATEYTIPYALKVSSISFPEAFFVEKRNLRQDIDLRQVINSNNGIMF